jgi:hypothetical protein
MTLGATAHHKSKKSMNVTPFGTSRHRLTPAMSCFIRGGLQNTRWACEIGAAECAQALSVWHPMSCFVRERKDGEGWEMQFSVVREEAKFWGYSCAW